MCISPKHIVNRSNHYNETMPLYMDVPCNKCEECRNKNRSEWFVRCYYEWLHSACSYFYTLTWNNEHLPHCGLTPCFDRNHVQKFIKRLRHHLKKYDVKLKYMVCCEFGELYQRPHLHAEFFLDKENINAFQFYRLVESCWIYGFVKAGDDLGRIKNTNAIRYVTKYVSKDFAYTEKFDDMYYKAVMRHYNMFLKWFQKRYPQFSSSTFYVAVRNDVLRCLTDSAPSLADKEFMKKIDFKMRSLFNRCRPFHLQSTKLGQSAQFVSELLQFYECVPVMQNGTPVSYPMPRYIKRKLWYDVLENENDGKRNRFVLNDKGRAHYKAVLNDRIDSAIKQYSEVFANVTKINWSCLELVNASIEGSKFGFASVNDLQFWVNNFDLDLRTLAIFDKVFKGRVIPFDWRNVPSCSEFYLNHWEDFFDRCLDGCSSWDFGKAYELSRKDFNLINDSLFDEHPFFQVYSHALNIISSIIVAWRSDDAKNKEINDRLSARTRQLFQKLNYQP